MLPEQSPSSSRTTENTGSLRRRSTASIVPIERAIKMPTAAEPPAKLCGACHFSCLRCFGPNDYDCMACAPDSEYTERAANESYCSPFARDMTNLYDGNLYGVLLVLVPALFILCLVLSVSWLLRTKWWAARSGSNRAGYTYEKVEFDGTDETVNLSHEVTVDGSSSTCSDSEEEPP